MNETRDYLKSQNQEDEDFIDLLPLIRAVWKKAWLVFLLAALCAVLSFVGVKLLVSPTYRTTFSAYVNNSSEGKQASLTSSDVTANKSLANTYNKIIVSRTVLQQAAQEANCQFSYAELKGMVESQVENNTEIITVSVTTHDPQLSKDLADAVYQVAVSVGSSVVDGSSMRAYELPEYPDNIYSPHYIRIVIIAFAATALVICAVIALQEFFDNRVKSQESLEERFGLVVLGSIPNFSSAFNNTDADYGYTAHTSGGKNHE